jgi:hypothetical protein
VAGELGVSVSADADTVWKRHFLEKMALQINIVEKLL